ncbi:MAG TPA: aldehyde dehydrogenase family protein [Labilithrix sp.]|nr:aldehyde dehydrogenase family protein [Labilithrix sp.]
MVEKKREQVATATEAAREPLRSTGEASLTKSWSTQKPRVSVAKAYKMFVGGAFVRSESGRYFQVEGASDRDADPETVNNPRGSRNDVRDAVLAAKNAAPGWEKRTAFNRGQILYRLAEVMESRKPELVSSLVRAGASEDGAILEVEASIDRAVFYAGFADKYFGLLASQNPVSGPHFNFSIPETMGVVGVVAPDRPSLLGLVSTVLPVVTGGNTCVALASAADPRTAIVWSECVATSDMPGGVVNVLTGDAKELSPHLAKHREVIGIDAWIVDADVRKVVESEGADNVKRVKTHVPMDPEAWLDERKGQGLGWIERFLETKTVWHPVGV